MLLIAIILVVIPVTISAYEPLTSDEATAWWSTLTSDERVQFIIDYDVVENTVPTIGIGGYTALLAGQDLYMIPPVDGMSIEIGHLSYQVDIPEMSWKGFIPKQASTFWRDFGWGTLAGVAASFAVAIVTITALGSL